MNNISPSDQSRLWVKATPRALRPPSYESLIATSNYIAQKSLLSLNEGEKSAGLEMRRLTKNIVKIGEHRSKCYGQQRRAPEYGLLPEVSPYGCLLSPKNETPYYLTLDVKSLGYSRLPIFPPSTSNTRPPSKKQPEVPSMYLQLPSFDEDGEV